MSTFFVFLVAVTITAANICNIRKVTNGSVCVCNSTYCDGVPKIQALALGKFQLYFTSKHKSGFNTKVGYFSKTQRGTKNIIKIKTKLKQNIIGFGGAFTDATGINIKSLSKPLQRKLLESYFGKNGIEYSLCRVPIGGTDFSPRPYTYDDSPGDTKLKNFALQEEDLCYKIPFIKDAIELRQSKRLKLFASAWTAPIWMKTYPEISGYAFLRDDYYQLWADYHVKFFDEYKKHGIDFWGMTTGNEPMDGFYSHAHSKINAMGWIPYRQSEWIRENLGPTLRKSSYTDMQIIIHDDDRISVPYVVPLMIHDAETLKHISGVGIHWYWDDQVDAKVLQLIKTDKKDLFFISSESCYFLDGVTLGSWERAAGYIGSIIEYLEYGFGGWVDWNMALNLTGGPTYINYVADSPIIVNETSQEFYKQPMFYAMGHFSKFLVPDSVRVDISHNLIQDTIKSIAFLRPDNLVALVIFNNHSTSVPIQIENKKFYSDIIEIESDSIFTILFPICNGNSTCI